MVHKIGQNLISNSAPCQHFILSFSVACESAVAFPSQSLQRKEKQEGKERTGEEKRSGSAPSLSSKAQQRAEETQGRFLISQPPDHTKQGLTGSPSCPKESHTREGVTFGMLLTFGTLSDPRQQ